MGLNAFIFNGESSADHGVIITQGASYNAPARAVEMVSIPGRNGAYVRDMGRYENVEVTYHVALAGKKQNNFASALAYLRSWLCAEPGYCRLSDTYNHDEYRMAIYKSGLEIEEAYYNGAEFDIVFDCKPQRFLTSGESTIEVEDGDSINNPTPFDAQPMIMTEGYGTLTVNGFEIEITNSVLGQIELGNSIYQTPFTFDGNLVENGDDLKVVNAVFDATIDNSKIPGGKTIESIETTAYSGQNTKNSIAKVGGVWMFQILIDEMDFEVGTYLRENINWSIRATFSDASEVTATLGIQITYDGTNKIHFSFATAGMSPYLNRDSNGVIGVVRADSTTSTLGHPTYIDCDLGEVYKIENGSFISLNHLTDLGSNLPVLAPGNNLVEYDNTFTSVEIIPHWWVV